MKKLIVICAAAIMAATTYGQGYVAFQNSTTTLITTNKNASGASTAVGNVLGAGNYVFGFFTAATGSTDPAVFTPQGYALSSARAAGGIFANNPLTTSLPASTVAFQVRGWSANLGADWGTVAPKLNINWVTGVTKEAVAGTIPLNNYFGWSTLGSVSLVTSPTPANATFGTAAGNVAGFALNEIQPVPEPSTIALGALGLMGVLFIRRRK